MYNLHSQEIQLSRILTSEFELPEDTIIPTLLDTCNCLQLHIDSPHTVCNVTKANLQLSKSYIHRLFTCDIQINGRVALYVYTSLKNSEKFESAGFSLVLLVINSGGSFKKIVCNSRFNDDLEENCSVSEVNPIQNPRVDGLGFGKEPLPSEWNMRYLSNLYTYKLRILGVCVPYLFCFRCYLLNIINSRILEIGGRIDGGTSICLCGIGIKDAAVLDFK